MMKKLVVLLLTLSLLCLCGAAFAQDAAEAEEETAEKSTPRFESIWGATIEDIESLEGDDHELEENENSTTTLCYSDRNYFNKAAVICYVIGKNGMMEADVYLDEDHKDGAEWVADYEDVKADLAEIYGTPMMDMVNSVTGESFDGDDDMTARGAALLDGAASWLTMWMDGTDSRIYMGMSADAENATTRIQVASLTITE